MAGRGGRGRGGKGRGFTFDIAAIGFGRGDQLPSSILQPPPSFPPLEFQPVPLNTSSADDYILSLKQEFRTVMRDSPYSVKPPVKNRDMERYSDRYKEGYKHNKDQEWKKDWRRFPKELKPAKPKIKKVGTAVKPRLDGISRVKRGNSQKAKPVEDVQLAKKLKELSEKGEQSDEEEGETGEQENDAEELEYDEEEQEEDNDYLLSYFEDGDDYGHGDDDDMDEGPTY